MLYIPFVMTERNDVMKTMEHTREEYERAVLDAMHIDYEWYTEEMLHNQDESTVTSVLKNPEYSFDQAVSEIVSTIKNHIEWSPIAYLKRISEYYVPFLPEEFEGGWRLEKYRFCKYEGNVYFSSVVAGDRNTGGGRTFYIPKRYIEGHSYEEFLDLYFSEIAPAGIFGLSKEILLKDGTVKHMFGYTEHKEHPEVQQMDLEDMTLYLMNDFIRGDCMEHIKQNQLSDHNNTVQTLWNSFRESLPSVMEYAVTDEQGRIPYYWGIMTDDNVFSSEVEFRTAWNHYYRTGEYVTAVQAVQDAPVLYNSRWKQRDLPSRHYVCADVTGKSDAEYDEIFMDYINRVIPEMGYMPKGAIVERIDPQTDEVLLMFPVEKG